MRISKKKFFELLDDNSPFVKMVYNYALEARDYQIRKSSPKWIIEKYYDEWASLHGKLGELYDVRLKEVESSEPTLYCDHCGTKNPETFEGRRVTKCCAVEKRERGTYEAVDENGKTWYAKGKTWSW